MRRENHVPFGPVLPLDAGAQGINVALHAPRDPEAIDVYLDNVVLKLRQV